VSIKPTYSATYATRCAENDAYNLIGNFAITADTITFECLYTKPTQELTLVVGWI
jgi:hypothetical protein